MKKKIGIVFSGQIRENALGNNLIVVPDCVPSDYLHDILESYRKNFFTDEFTNDNDYDVFISTDNINIEKTLDFFGKDNVKNIHLSDNDYHLHPIQTELKSVDYYLERMYSLTDDKHKLFPDVIHQYHRMADCYEMLRNHNSHENYDYIIRTRLDTVYHYNINEHIKTLNDNSSLSLLGNDDQYAVGRPAIMNVYFDAINTYCTYQNYYHRNNFKTGLCTIEHWQHFLLNPVNEITYKYSTMQLLESLYQYCDHNNLKIDNSIQCVNYGIIRRHIEHVIKSQPKPIEPPSESPETIPVDTNNHRQQQAYHHKIALANYLRARAAVSNKRPNKTNIMPMRIIFQNRQ